MIKFSRWNILLSILLIIMIFVIIIWLAILSSPISFQSVMINLPLDNINRYETENVPLISIEATINVSMRRKNLDYAKIIKEELIAKYKDSIIMNEVDIFAEPLGDMKKIPIHGIATLENVAMFFYDKLAPLIKKGKLKSIRINEANTGIQYSRY